MKLGEFKIDFKKFAKLAKKSCKPKKILNR